LQDRIKFAEGEIEVIKKALKTKLFRADEDEEIRAAKYQAMLDDLAAQFSIPAPKLEKVPGDEPGYTYDPDTNTIQVQRFSLVSILDGFANAFQFHTEHGEADGASGEFILSFGLSAFKQAAPAMFESARQAGRLMGVDVLYTDGGRRPANVLPRGLPSSIVAMLLGGMQPGPAAAEQDEDQED
jgi:hypothetical protein